TSLLDGAPDDALRDSELAHHIRKGGSGAVFLDAIIETGRACWSGHVYNLETDSGAFIANGIITHNCRSIMLPLLRMPRATDRPTGSFEEFIASLSPAEQEELLGKGRAELWRRGVITKTDLVNQRGRELTLRQLRGM
ncbi:MAG: hypothetical protein ACRDAM_21960, partial [Casimicrobium sp.]